MNATVTAFGDQPSLANTQVAHGENLRMYSRPAQCSSFSRSMTAAGCPPARSSASVGPDILVNSLRCLSLRHAEALQDRVPSRPGFGPERDGPGKFGRRHADVAGSYRQPVPGQAAVDQLRLDWVVAQVGAEQRAQAGQLTVARGTRVELIDRMHDLVIAAAARPARASHGHRHPAHDQRLGEHSEELVGPRRTRMWPADPVRPAPGPRPPPRRPASPPRTIPCPTRAPAS